MEGDDIVYFREEVHNNKVALGPGRDRGIAHEGSTFAMYNKFKGDDDDDKLFVKGHKNWLHGVNGKDKIVAMVASGVDARGRLLHGPSTAIRRSSLVASYAGRQEHLTRRRPPRQDRGLRGLQPPTRPLGRRYALGAARLHG